MDVVITESFINGAVSAEPLETGCRPWRLPHHRRHLFPSPGDGLMGRAQCTSGVRLRFATDATAVSLRFAAMPPVQPQLPDGHAFDLVVENEIVDNTYANEGDTSVSFSGLPGGDTPVEIWLPPSCGVDLQHLTVPADSQIRPLPDRRPMWVTWGSSLTHCVRAGSAARTWPATVARTHDLNLVCLGFGGQCHLDPMVAMLIRDLPADLISLKLGINTVSGSVNARTYGALVTAAVAIIREKHVHTPLALVSPIGYPPHETNPNAVNYTIGGMRADMAAVHRRLVAHGDRSLYYVDGLEIFNLEEIAEHTEDQCHPGAAGIDIKAVHFSEKVMPLLLGEI
jgi:hypothetical protein